MKQNLRPSLRSLKVSLEKRQKNFQKYKKLSLTTSDLHHENEELKEQIHHLEKQNTRLEDENNEQAAHLDELKRLTESYDQENKEFESYLKKAEQQNSTMNTEKLETALKELKEALDKATQAAFDANSRAEKQEKKYLKLLAEVQVLKKQLLEEK